MLTSEFADEYQDWLEGTGAPKPNAPWFDRALSEVQHAPLLSVEAHVSVADVIELMNAHHQTAVVVMTGGQLGGIFTERDVLTRVVPQRLDARKVQVGELMTPHPHVLSETTLLSAAMRTLALANYHHLPVVDESGKPKAVISLQTVVRCLLDAFPREIMNAPPEGNGCPPAPEGA